SKLVYLTHGTGLVALCASIDRLWSNLSLSHWACILLVLMVAEWSFSLGGNLAVWRRSAWNLGLLLATMSYSLLWADSGQFAWRLVWLITPLMLTIMASLSLEPHRQRCSWLSVVALCLTPFLLGTLPWTRWVGLSFAASLMVVNTYYLQRQLTAAIAIGFGLGFGVDLLYAGGLQFALASRAEWLVVGAITIFGLWIWRSWLLGWSGWGQDQWIQQARLYGDAANGWSVTLYSLELAFLTGDAIALQLSARSPSMLHLLAGALLVVAVFYRNWRQPNDLAIYPASWGFELLMVEVIALRDGGILELAIANVALGGISLFLTGRLQAQASAAASLSSLKWMPLLYVWLGTCWRINIFNRWTGLLSLGTVLVSLEVGQRTQQRWLQWLSLCGVSIAWYELVGYQLLQAEGGYLADGLLILALVAAVIMVIYRLGAAWLTRFLHFSRAELIAVAHCHWAVGSGLILLAAQLALTMGVSLVPLAGLLSLVLPVYAIWQGRSQSAWVGWVYLGWLEAGSLMVYGRLIWPQQLGFLDVWVGVIVAGIGVMLYMLPWERWGWSQPVWQRMALILPIVAVATALRVINPINLIVVGGYYLWLSYRLGRIRLTYFSVVLFNWAIARWWLDFNFTDLLAYVAPVGLSLLYIAQVDPGLKSPNQRQIRHTLRLFGIGIIHLAAFFSNHWTAIPVGLLGLLTGILGLTLRIRAFLYLGTVTFLLNAFNQLVILNAAYPLVKWIVGILVGITFIWIAASFETRRQQLTSLVNDWAGELEAWD
ncbi:MAG: DUF2157 domain-containing protein, partial [Cyanothece sp. SIO1E1]|nr:DUF2157 domain-containing protein [Cyanothece sp. SIO1E1]